MGKGYEKRMIFNLYPTPYIVINSKLTSYLAINPKFIPYINSTLFKNLHVRSESIKLLKKIQGRLHRFVLGSDILAMSPEAQANKEKGTSTITANDITSAQ